MATPSGAGAAPAGHDHFTMAARPTCPSVLIPFENQLYALPVQRLDCQCEFNVSTAFVKITGVWKNIAKYKSDCLFVLPLMGTVTSVSITINKRLFETAIIPREEAEKLKADSKQKESKETKAASAAGGAVEMDDKCVHLPPMSFEEYIPNLFRLPIQGVASTDYITVSVVYIEPLYFVGGQYKFTLPLKFGANLVPAKKNIQDILSVRCVINSVSPSTRWECKTHEMRVTKTAFARVELEAIGLEKIAEAERKAALAAAPPSAAGAPPPAVMSNASLDFTLGYSMSSAEILPTLITQANEDGPEGGTFLMFVTPPSIDQDSFFTRKMVFLLDRSGSMNGEPYVEATRALVGALQNLRPTDLFTIIAFDHRQEYFRTELVEATADHLAAATSWVRQFQPERGGTDIQTPLEWSLKLLESDEKESLVLPFVVLLTDGCVGNERLICQFAHLNCKRTRVLTFGIGSYCNWFFLKMLAQIGRGFSDVVVYKEKIYEQMLQLLNMAAVPVITNIQLNIPGVKSMELYPFPIPDLFMGAPLTISGKFEGKFPASVALQGVAAGGLPYSVSMVPRTSDVIPVNKVFIKQRLDLLTARSWLEDSAALRNEIIDLSCSESMPSAYTMMVAYETTPEEKKEDETASLLSPGASSSAGGGKAPMSAIARAKLADKKWYKNPKTLAGIGVGGAILIGAAAFSFGDIAASAGNLPVVELLGGGLGHLLDASCCGDCGGCGGCDCGGCDCGGCDCGDCLAC